MAGREVFVTNVGCPDSATRKLSDVGIEKPFPTNTYRLSPIENLAPFWRDTYPKLKQQLQRGSQARMARNGFSLRQETEKQIVS